MCLLVTVNLASVYRQYFFSTYNFDPAKKIRAYSMMPILNNSFSRNLRIDGLIIAIFELVLSILVLIFVLLVLFDKIYVLSVVRAVRCGNFLNNYYVHESK